MSILHIAILTAVAIGAIYLLLKGIALGRKIRAMQLSSSSQQLRGINADVTRGASMLSRQTIATWDVFDTLIARYCVDPLHVFAIVGENFAMPTFPELRQRAQSDLDALGPYGIFDIYRKIQDYGIDATLAERLLAEELRVESEQIIPIRRNIERVEKQDILVSDMYLPSEIIGDLVSHAAGFVCERPVVAGNWGKASGAVWPLLQKHYQISIHHGDNPHSDQAAPAQFNIPIELVHDHEFTQWEMSLIEAGELQLALLLRETRLRSIPAAREHRHDVVCGPLLSVILIYALEIRRRYSKPSMVVFCSRDGDQLAAIFRALFPTVPSVTLDLNRQLTAFGTHDAFFNKKIPDGSVIVDLVATGRSVLSYLKRNPAKMLSFHTLLYVDEFLDADEIASRMDEVKSGLFQYQYSKTDFPGQVPNLEFLLQPGYDIVDDVQAEHASGAVVRRHRPEQRDDDEHGFLKFKSIALRELARGIKRRPINALLASGQSASIMRRALDDILSDDSLLKTSMYIEREKVQFQNLVSLGNTLASR